MKKIKLIALAFLMCFSISAYSQDTLIVKKDNHEDTILCKITKITSMNVFYTQNKIGKTIPLSDIVYHSKYESNTSDNKEKETTSKSEKTAGDELITSAKHFYTGATLMLVGGGLISLSIVLPPAAIVGGVVILVGEIFILESHSHVKKAGVILNQK